MDAVRRKDLRVWLGLVLLGLGTLLADRSFASWRNDGQNFAHFDGKYYADAQLARLSPEPSRWERPLRDHEVLYSVFSTGLVMMAVSAVLLADASKRAD